MSKPHTHPYFLNALRASDRGSMYWLGTITEGHPAPVARWLATASIAERHLADAYPDTDFDSQPFWILGLPIHVIEDGSCPTPAPWVPPRPVAGDSDLEAEMKRNWCDPAPDPFTNAALNILAGTCRDAPPLPKEDSRTTT